MHVPTPQILFPIQGLKEDGLAVWHNGPVNPFMQLQYVWVEFDRQVPPNYEYDC